MSPREAANTDTQHRLFLQECWKVLEDAGYAPADLSGKPCGVYVGAADGDYQQRLQDETTMPYTLMGNTASILSARIAYLLNLKGPSIAINTACSSSLVAIHMAQQSILSGECEMALAGGVYLQTEADMHIRTSKAGMLSEDGKCKAFDQSANGFVPGEGAGVIMLKKLSAAERDGDHIYGVIAGSKINQDGSTNGITAPSAESQKELEMAVYKDFAINPGEISYVEAHGTGTKLGDPIEIDALTRSFGAFTDQKQFCAIGSVKTNIGHALMAAGVAGVIKVLMAMKHQQLAPSLHFDQANEHINFGQSPFYVNTELKPWEPVNGKRLAAVSSFGFSGTNAHLVLEDYQKPIKAGKTNGQSVVLPVSAASEAQLKTYVGQLKNDLEAGNQQLANAAFTLQTGRKPMKERVAFIAANKAGLLKSMTDFLSGGTSESIVTKAALAKATNATSKIANAWAAGKKVDWTSLYSERPGKVSLPTYPFEKLKCWIDRKVSAVRQVTAPAAQPLAQAPQPVQSSPVIMEADLSAIKAFLKHELSEQLYLDEEKITDQREFAKIGLDSVVGVEIVNKINQEYGLNLEAKVVYDYPTVSKLAAFIGSATQPVQNMPAVTETGVPQQVTPIAASHEEIILFLKERLAEILYLDAAKITDQREFSQIGLDSVVGVELINVINGEYDTSLEANCLYEFNNVTLLAAHIANQGAATAQIVVQPAQVEAAASSIDIEEIKDFLRQQLSTILYLDVAKIKDMMPFSTIGLDSVVGVELINEVNTRYQLTLEAGCLYEFGNVASFSAHIQSQVSSGTAVSLTPAVPADKPIVVAESRAARPVPMREHYPVIEANVNRAANGKVLLPDLSQFKAPSKQHVKPRLVQLSDLEAAVRGDVHVKDSAVQASPKATAKPGVDASTEMAIIGIAGRYPKSKNLQKFWKNLKAGKNCISEIPKERWDIGQYFNADKTVKHSTYSKFGGFISDVDQFSPLFFNISPREAEMMDPQERLLLESVWETVENAGYDVGELSKDRVGVFMGSMINQYPLVTADRNKSADLLNTTTWSLANRLSFFFDFRGPSIAVNTACSSSLSAIYMACESIKRGECEVAVAGGVNLNLHPSKWTGLSKNGMISAGNESKSMGQGDGYLPGEGVGTILIKPLKQAEADKDHIYGVVKGGFMNHGGRSAGFTVPTGEGQKTLTAGVLAAANMSADQIDYIESASNGSPVGDPVEMNNLIAAFANVKKKVAVGTVKSNIGHCEAASGISQVTKVLLQYQHQLLVPSINAEPLHADINLEDSNLKLQRATEQLSVDKAHHSLINSFGAGGSNTQLIIGNYQQKATEKPTETVLSGLVILSAEDKATLKKQVGNLLDHLNCSPNLKGLANLAYTLQVGRRPMEERLAFVVDTVADLKALLKKYLSGKEDGQIHQNPEPILEFKPVVNGKEKNLLVALKEDKRDHIANLWVSGYSIEWSKYYEGVRPARMPLPTYPFDRQRIWVSDAFIEQEAPQMVSAPSPTTKQVFAHEPVKIKESALAPRRNNEEAKEKAISYLQEKFEELLKVPKGKFDPSKPFSHYGVDSILIKEITGHMEKDLGALPKTLFFRYANPDELANFLKDRFQDRISRPVQEEPRKVAKIETQPVSTPNQPSSEVDVREALSKLIAELICDTLKIPAHKLDTSKAFAHYGIDSILVREITGSLEKQLGALPKTLFFQCANVDELVAYLDRKYKDQIIDKLGLGRQLVAERTAVATPAASTNEFLVAKTDLSEAQIQLMQELGGRHAYGFYLLELWTHLYFDSEKQFYFHVLPEGDTLYLSFYGGPNGGEVDALQQVTALAAEQGYQVGYWSPSNIDSIDGFLGTPIGTLQTVQNIAAFDLEGGKKKRLRYLVNKYAKAGTVRVTEYTDCAEETDEQIAQIILAWTAHKKFVNNVEIVLDEIKHRNWQRRCRIFLTYFNEELQNVILINKLPMGVYLMDQEFYLPEATLGGTEYSVIEIMKTLASEGEAEFSFGLTWQILDSGRGNDAAGIQLLAELKGKETALSQIYEGGAKNFQYKMKFGPENVDFVFYRPAGSSPEFIVDFLSVFMQHGSSHAEVAQLMTDNHGEDGQVKTTMSAAPAEQPITSGTEIDVEKNLNYTEADDEFFDITKVPAEKVTHDLISDSWVYYRNATVRERMMELSQRISPTEDYTGYLKELLNIPYLHITPMGRSAEKLYFQSCGVQPGIILANPLFYTTIHHMVDSGFQLVELPDSNMFDLASNDIFRGGIDLKQAEEWIIREQGKVQCLMIELCNNASGGFPVTLQHLRASYQLAQAHGIRMILDITRILKNAQLIKMFETGMEEMSIWDIVSAIISCADDFTGSLSKDFCVNSGGLVGSRFPEVVQKAVNYAKLEGSFFSEIDQSRLGESIKDLNYLETAVMQQIETTRRLNNRLLGEGLPAVTGATAHCLLIDASQFPDYQTKYGKEQLLKDLLEQTGIRGGVHMPGQLTGTTLNDCIRICIPLGLTDNEEEEIGEGLIEFFQSVLPVVQTTSIAQSIDAGHRHLTAEPVAIVGLSVKFPSAENQHELWGLIKDGRNSIGAIPEVRTEGVDIANLSPALKQGAYMEGADLFDPAFFGIAPKEARLMDPQQRLILEKSWEAIEDAGYTRETLAESRTGVFVGIPHADYRKHDVSDDSNGTTGLISSLASNRISYTFNLHGPSEVYNTNCSSSFVALHRAIQSMRFDECDQAIVGGVQVMVGLDNLKTVEALGILSPTGQSLSFDHKADGYVRSEGVGAMLIKPLSKAKADGDHIYAVVKGTAVGHGGAALSLTAPSAKGMKEVITKAYQTAGIAPQTIQYVEAHGISSPTPDAIELDAIAEAFDEMTETSESSMHRRPIKIGSIKPNIGHAEYASGMAIITKVIQAMHHQTMPGVTNFEKLSEEAMLNEAHFSISATNEHWPIQRDEAGNALPRRASLNSYGTGGVNAHIVLEEFRQRRLRPSKVKRPQLFVLSADSEDILRRYAADFMSFLTANRQLLTLEQVVYTMQVGREARPVRLTVLSESLEELTEKLQQFADGQTPLNAHFAHVDQIGEEERQVFEGLNGKSVTVEDLEKAGAAWTTGDAINWDLLHGGKTIQKVSLPTYPFSKKSYWTATKPPVAIVSKAPAANVDQEQDSSEDPLNFQSIVLQFIAEELEIPMEEIMMDKPMAGFGMDSIVGQKLSKELKTRYQIKLSGKELLTHPTVKELSGLVQQKYEAKHGKAAAGNQRTDNTDAALQDELDALQQFKDGQMSLEEIEKMI